MLPNLSLISELLWPTISCFLTSYLIVFVFINKLLDLSIILTFSLKFISEFLILYSIKLEFILKFWSKEEIFPYQ